MRGSLEGLSEGVSTSSISNFPLEIYNKLIIREREWKMGNAIDERIYV